MADAETFPSWRYGPNGESAVFDNADDVPKGWKDAPFAPPAGLREQLEASVAAFDHDGNGEPGGSLPKAKRKTASKTRSKRP